MISLRPHSYNVILVGPRLRYRSVSSMYEWGGRGRGRLCWVCAVCVRVV